MNTIDSNEITIADTHKEISVSSEMLSNLGLCVFVITLLSILVMYLYTSSSYSA